MAHLLLPALAHGFMVAQQFQGQGDQVVKVHALVGREALFVVPHYARNDAFVVVLGQQPGLLGVQPLAFPAADGPLPGAGRGRVHNVRRARAQAQVIDHLLQLGHGLGHVKGRVLYGREQHGAPRLQRRAAHVFMAGAKGNLVDAGGGGAARLAKTGAHARQVLHLQAHMFEYVCSPSAFLQALQKAATHAGAAFMLNQAGQQGSKALVETGEGVGRVLLQRAYVDPSFDDRAVGPDIGAAQIGDPEDFNIDLV